MENIKQVYTEHCNRGSPKTNWFWLPPKLCPWQKSSSDVTEMFQSPGSNLCLQLAMARNQRAAAT